MVQPKGGGGPPLQWLGVCRYIGYEFTIRGEDIFTYGCWRWETVPERESRIGNRHSFLSRQTPSICHYLRKGEREREVYGIMYM